MQSQVEGANHPFLARSSKEIGAVGVSSLGGFLFPIASSSAGFKHKLRSDRRFPSSPLLFVPCANLRDAAGGDELSEAPNVEGAVECEVAALADDDVEEG